MTNTIYPLREQAGTIVKPRYRLREKRSPRSPDFSVRVGAARVLPGGFLNRDARLAPGGGPLDVENFRAISKVKILEKGLCLQENWKYLKVRT